MLALSALDSEIGRYLGHGSFGYRTIQLEKEHPVTERPVAAWEVHAIRLSLARNGIPQEEAAKAVAAEVGESLGEDRGNVVALRIKASKSKGEAASLAADAIEGHPEDYRAWLFRGDLSKDVAARESDFRKAVELAPESEYALNELAWLLVTTEREGEALPLAKRAAALAPWSAATLDTLAAAVQGLGRCTDALFIQRRAVDVLSELAPADMRKRFSDRVDALAASCGSAPAAPAAAPAAKKP